METVLGIDLGTQSVKALFYDPAAHRVVAAGAAPLAVARDASGRAEQRAEDWLEALQAALAQVPASVRASTRAIGVSGQQHGFVAVDSTGTVLAPVKLWCDTSTQAEADAITAACGGRERAIAATGNPVLVGYTASKIRWLAERHPQLYRRMSRILLPHDYLNFVLTGVAAMELGDASGTGLLDVRARQWSPLMLRAVDSTRDLADCLPPLLAPQAVVGTTSASNAEGLGLPAGVPVAPGGGDNMMAAIGTGNVTAGRLTISLGTSGTLFAHSDAPVIDERGNIAAFCGSTGGWLPLLCTMNCTFASELMRNALGVSVERLDATLGAVPAGAEGLLALPFFAGERTPDLPRATASLLGLAAHNCTAAHLLRATVEGATYGLRFGLDELRRLGMAGERIVLTGGGAKSRIWSQIVADVCRLPVTQVAIDEGASFGAALQALWVLRRRTDSSLTIAELAAEHVRPRPELGVEPRPAEAERYERGYATYRRAVAEVAPFSTADA
jgi:xylulokinase